MAGIGLAAHADPGEGGSSAVFRSGVGRQIHVGGMLAEYVAAAANVDLTELKASSRQALSQPSGAVQPISHKRHRSRISLKQRF